MIRAVRFACRFAFTIDPETEKAVRAHAKELFPPVAMERVVQELGKMANFPNLREALLQLFDYGLLQEIFPKLESLERKDIEELTKRVPDFPHQLPIIAYLLELFPDFSEKEKEELCKYLKLSNQDINFTLFLGKTQKLFAKKDSENLDWAYFYANPFAHSCLGIMAAHLDIEKRPAFIALHEKKRAELQNFITRILERKPVVSSSHLIEIGIQPGKKMGDLLAEAEKISINEMLEDPKAVLEKLHLKN